jgi:hypothetical protein
MRPIKGVIYDMELPKGEVLRVQLAEIESSGFLPCSYLFRSYTPHEFVDTSSHVGGFPLPEALLSHVKFTEVTGPDADKLLAEPCEVPFKPDAIYKLFAGMPAHKDKSPEELIAFVDSLKAESDERQRKKEASASS